MLKALSFAFIIWSACCIMPAHAKTTCTQDLLGTFCISEVDFNNFYQQAFQDQLQSQWCWAASISMIYSYYGHPISQARIVSEVYGAPINMPAQAGIVIARQLNRDWTDDNGSEFRSRVTGLYDADAGILSLTNNQIIEQLENDRPIVMGARAHAMVLTQIRYYRTIFGPNVVGAGVFDPWPGIGPRDLAPDELVAMHLGGSLRFVATVTTNDSEQSSDKEDSGAFGTDMLILLLPFLIWNIYRARSLPD